MRVAHTDEKQVKEALRALLQESERERDPAHLRKVLSDFFLALPEPCKAIPIQEVSDHFPAILTIAIH